MAGGKGVTCDMVVTFPDTKTHQPLSSGQTDTIPAGRRGEGGEDHG